MSYSFEAKSCKIQFSPKLRQQNPEQTLSKNPDISPDTVVYIRILQIVGYMIGFEAVRNASDICFGRLEMHNTYINVFEAKIEKASGRRESNSGHLACSPSALPLSYNSHTTTNPHNLYMYCTGGTEYLSCTPGSHSVQNPVRGQPENSLHQERTHSEWFSQSKCLELLPHVGIKRD